jgi:uncharacterized protein (DUF305 family)
MTRKYLLLSVVATAALLTGCGGASVSDVANDVADQAADTIADFNAADVMFAQMMIPHHEQAIEMSDIALDPTVGASDVVRDLATRIKGAQDPEIATMQGFLTSWKMSLTMDPNMDHGDMMSGMLSAQDIADLSALRGADFDRAWMAGMIAHHEGAIEMAEDVVRGGKNAAVKTLANSITAAQDAEITEMKKLLG